MKWIIVTLLFVAGCATSVFESGRDFDVNKSKSIVPDKTTKADVVEMLGQPFSKNVSGSIEAWGYFYTRSVGKASIGNASATVLAKQINIVFDSLGVVKSTSYTLSGDPK